MPSVSSLALVASVNSVNSVKFYGSLTLLHFPTGGANDAQNVSVDTARGKFNDQQNLYKNDM